VSVRERARAFFIDGPEHGTTRTLDGEPPREWLVPRMMSMSHRSLTEGADDAPTALVAVDRYVLTYRTRGHVWIFEWDGAVT